jgi:hypothetical protein
VLSLELQRSLDYYESHFDETAIGDLTIAPAGSRANMLAAELGARPVCNQMFNIHDLVDVPSTPRSPTAGCPAWPSGAMRARAGMVPPCRKSISPTGVEGRAWRAGGSSTLRSDRGHHHLVRLVGLCVQSAA